MKNSINYFGDKIPYRARCANEIAIDNRLRSRDRAINYRLIDPNTAKSIRWLSFSIDRPCDAMDWEDCSVSPPTIVCQNPENGHAHLLYALQTPVFRFSCAHFNLLNRLEEIEHSLSISLESNTINTGGLVYNPLHSYWRVFEVGGIYTLDELANTHKLRLVPRLSRSSSGPITCLHRNCEIIERLKAYARWEVAHRAMQGYWDPECHQEAYDQLCAELEYFGNDIQGDFHTPLAADEIRLIARSVARWIW